MTFQVRVQILTIIYQHYWLTQVSQIFGDTLILWRMQEHEFHFGHYQNKMKTGFLITPDKVDFYFTNAPYYASALAYAFQLDLKEYPTKASFGYFSEYGIQPDVVGKVFQNSSSRYEQLLNWFRGMKHLTQVEFHKTDFYRNVYRLID